MSVKKPSGHFYCGIPTFAMAPLCEDLDNLDADVAVLGIPFENTMGNVGARMGPRAIREASVAGRSEIVNGYYHLDDDTTYLGAPWKFVDCGDVPIAASEVEPSFTYVREHVAKIAKSDAILVSLGGDHAITIPVLEALEERGPFGIIHIDAHMDWADGERHYGHDKPMRRASEMAHVTKMAQLGIRHFPTTSIASVKEAMAYGSVIMSTDKIREIGIEEAVSRIPKCERYYVSIDIDGMDPSIAPGTGGPAHDGFYYQEVRKLLKGIAGLGDIVGMDLVEVAPNLDVPSQITSHLASRILLDFIGFIFKERERKGLLPVR